MCGHCFKPQIKVKFYFLKKNDEKSTVHFGNKIYELNPQPEKRIATLISHFSPNAYNPEDSFLRQSASSPIIHIKNSLVYKGVTTWSNTNVMNGCVHKFFDPFNISLGSNREILVFPDGRNVCLPPRENFIDNL